MTCDLTSFSTVFQSYQDNGRITPFTVEKISPQAGIEPGTERSVGQCLTYRATGALRCSGAATDAGFNPKMVKCERQEMCICILPAYEGFKGDG